jgi:hypothetical protein
LISYIPRGIQVRCTGQFRILAACRLTYNCRQVYDSIHTLKCTAGLFRITNISPHELKVGVIVDAQQRFPAEQESIQHAHLMSCPKQVIRQDRSNVSSPTSH